MNAQDGITIAAVLIITLVAAIALYKQRQHAQNSNSSNQWRPQPADTLLAELQQRYQSLQTALDKHDWLTVQTLTSSSLMQEFSVQQAQLEPTGHITLDNATLLQQQQSPQFSQARLLCRMSNADEYWLERCTAVRNGTEPWRFSAIEFEQDKR